MCGGVDQGQSYSHRVGTERMCMEMNLGYIHVKSDLVRDILIECTIGNGIFRFTRYLQGHSQGD